MSMIVLSSHRNLQPNIGFSSFLGSRQRTSFSHGSVHCHKTWRPSMLLKTKPDIKDGVLSIKGKDALTGVPENIVVTPWTDSSAFVGATSSHSSSRHVFKLGVIQDARLLCLFRFKIWWMIPRVGNSGSDIPVETQMMLLEARESKESLSYVLFLPVLDGEFRSSLQGNSANELELCVESGKIYVNVT
ncbi:Galactinol--sucrose galactosyltransferase [Actinidia chinensis var. chinensis]|uniref:Galactinol--sucrose galactosyltransferase n=1 Tax=Actinidia chinensis var. chinensis TaxID=1590841 RepID=A0A2R6Q9R9_ACTCC|nr:Galactinol--sucrose galactosyltransferase [Actinidia chinensis var. chinensis]